MQFFKICSIIASILGMTLLMTDGGRSQTNDSTELLVVIQSTDSTFQSTNASDIQSISKLKGPGGHSGKGGQVIESGAYYLELVTEKEANGTHLDLYLHNSSNHQSIPNAKVTAQVQLPNGTQKSLNFKYDASGKHYTGLLPGTASGTYKVVILSDINGKKVNGRFSFNR